MPRPGYRVRLESGLKLDLTWLIRQRVIVPGARFERPQRISWGKDGEEIAAAKIMFDLQGQEQGYIDIKIGGLDERISLVARPRHFGGRQWYFICPYMNRRVSVLWMPPGAHSFACRQKWGRQVAYGSQFLTWIDRAHRGKAKIKSRLARLAALILTNGNSHQSQKG